MKGKGYGSFYVFSILHHVGQEFAEDLIIQVIDFIVTLTDFLGKAVVLVDERGDRIPDHVLGQFGHAGEIDQRLHWLC
jgi:hypothetical protein